MSVRSSWGRDGRAVRWLVGTAVMAAGIAALAALPAGSRGLRESVDRAGPPPTAAPVSSFPRQGDLTVAGRAGDTLVGLTIRPGLPGRNHVVAYLAPDPPPAAGTWLSTGSGNAALAACGPSCRSGTLSLGGGEQIVVRVGGEHGGSVRLPVPALPAPDGSALVQRATRKMAALQRYRVDELFSGIHSSYTFARPHQMWMRTWFSGKPRDTLWLGSSVYTRSDPTADWSAPKSTDPVPVPYLAWQPFAPFVDASTVGAGTVDGLPVSLVSFFGGHGDDPEPVWFTLWVDRTTDRVLRSQMWAPSHFMDDRYYAFDQPVDVPRPSRG
jgi:hypothetical protein